MTKLDPMQPKIILKLITPAVENPVTRKIHLILNLMMKKLLMWLPTILKNFENS